MFPRFSEVLLAIEDLQQRGLLVSYAVFGAIAQMFWDEAIPTFDLDVLVVLGGQTGTLVDLGPLYQWSREKGYSAGREHIVIGEIPVQFVPAPDELHEEAIRTAAVLDFDGLPVNVVRPEYLIATWLAVNATHVVHSGVSGNNGGYHTNPLLLEGLPNESSS